MTQVDALAGRVGQAIKDASEDKLKNSWWDRNVRQTLHDHAQLLRWISPFVVFATGVAFGMSWSTWH